LDIDELDRGLVRQVLPSLITGQVIRIQKLRNCKLCLLILLRAHVARSLRVTQEKLFVFNLNCLKSKEWNFIMSQEHVKKRSYH